ncbi:MAG: ArnT family glycosyltransferase [Pirellulaceae bacterium]
MPHLSLHRLVILLVLGCVIFLTQLGAARLWDRDEPRNSRASHEMLARGDWVVPTFNGELRDHKPILLYWGQMASYKYMGESEFTARLPSALCALLTLTAVALLASRLSGTPTGINRVGFWSAASLATCSLFVMAGRAATPDSCLIAFSTLGIAALAIAATQPAKPFSSGRVGQARWIPGMFGYTMLGLAALAKGPVGIILPLAVVHSWWMVCNAQQNTRAKVPDQGTQDGWLENLRIAVLTLWNCFNPLQIIRSLLALRTIPGLVVCLLAAVPWYVSVGLETNGAFLRGFFIDHNVGRAMGAMEGHNGSIFFYPIAFLAGTFPWSLWAAVIVLWAVRSAKENAPNYQLVVLAACWVATYVGAFTLASTKLPSYITPCYPGACLVVGGFLAQFESTLAVPKTRWRIAANVLACVVGMGMIVGFYQLSSMESMPGLRVTCIAGGALLLAGVAGLAADQFRKPQFTPGIWLSAATGVQITLFAFGAPAVDKYRQELDVVLGVQQTMPASSWISVGGMEPSWVHYLGEEIHEIKTNPHERVCWAEVEKQLGRDPTAYLILSGDETIEIAERELSSGYRLRRVAAAERFLKSGTLAVMQALPDGLAPGQLASPSLPPKVENSGDPGPKVQPSVNTARKQRLQNVNR